MRGGRAWLLREEVTLAVYETSVRFAVHGLVTLFLLAAAFLSER